MTAETIASLASMPQQFERLFQSLPVSHTHWKPRSWEGVPGEMFSALEHACHLRDIEIDGYQVRIRRTQEESRPVLPSIDGYSLAEERLYREADPARAIAEFRAARRATVEQIQRLGESQLARAALFEGYGEVTLKGLIHFLCSHDQQHLACMHWLLGRMESNSP